VKLFTGLLPMRAETSGVRNPADWLSRVIGGHRSSSGMVVTPESALTISAVYACVRGLMDPGIPNNGGYFRPISVKVYGTNATVDLKGDRFLRSTLGLRSTLVKATPF
jgi:hypothetical protein